MFKPKAIFFGGISGAGKTSYIELIKSISKKRFISINSDDFAQPMLQEYDLLKMKSFDELGTNQKEIEKQTEILSKAKVLTAQKIEKVLIKRKNIIIDATSRSVEEITVKKKELEALGYETFFVLVISDLKTAIDRNNERERSVHPNTIRAMYKQIEDNLKYSVYQNLFKTNYIYINNNTQTAIRNLSKIIRSNLPVVDGVDKYNKRVITRLLNWINRSTEQNSATLSHLLSDYLINKKQRSKFRSSIKKIKESYQFRV